MIITGFQLRSSRKVLNLTLDQLSKNCGVSKVTLSRLINTIDNNNEITCSAQNAEKIILYFNSQQIIFPDKNTIKLDKYIEPKPVDTNLTRFQFITARVAMNLSQKRLAKYTELGHGSFQRFEEQNNTCYIKSNKIEIRNFILFFNTHGISFPNNKSVKFE
jgi:transcriptional regulator with XRE-family HTH domain